MKSTASWCCGGWRSAITCWSAATTWISLWRTTPPPNSPSKAMKLDPWQSSPCGIPAVPPRRALLAAEAGAEKHTLSVLGRGSRLIGGTVSVEVDRASAANCWLTASFPSAACTIGRSGDEPPDSRRSACRSRATPRSLATWPRFSARTRVGVRPPAAFRSHVLFNGGVFKAETLRSGCWRCCGQWRGRRPADHVLEVRGRSGPRRGPRRGLLRLDETPRRRADSRRRGPLVLRRHRNGRAGDSRRRRGRCGRCASCRSAWKKEPRSTSRRTRSAWCSASRPSSASSARRSASRIDPAMSCRSLDRRRAGRDRFARDDAAGGRRRSTNPTCRSGSNRGSPSWASSSCGV